MKQRFVINGKFLRAPPTGVHRVAAELSNALAALKVESHPALDGFDFELWAPGDGAHRAAGIALPLRIVGPLTGIPWEQLTLPLALRGQTLLSFCNFGPVLSRNALTMIHDVQVHLSPKSYGLPFRLWYRIMQPLFARRHRLVLTVSHFSRREIARVGLAPPSKIAVVHNGVDHIERGAADGAVVQLLALRRHGYAVALATTQAHKNIGLLLRAFADARLANLHLVLFGSANGGDFAAAGHAVPPNVRFAGRVTDAELRGLIESALCMAFPSTTEGFGLPPLEAMWLGCPVVAAPCGALPEVCGDAAEFAAADDPAAWAQAIIRLADDADHRAGMAERGRLHARRFTWRRAALALVSELGGRATR